MVVTSDMNQHVAAVMEAMGWPEDAFIPIANEENRKLLESIEQQMEIKQMKISHRDQLNERVKLLRDHHHNAETGIIENLKLINSYRCQCESEYHLLKLADNERSTVEQLKGDVKKEIIKLDENNLMIHGDMNRINEKIDHLGGDMQWMKDALIEWAQAIDNDDKTNALIEKYCQDDQKKADALEIRRQALQKTIIKNRVCLSELESEKQSLEQVLERTSALYAQTIRERHEMTKTWANAVQTLNERHKTIHETMEKTEQTKVLNDRKNGELKEQVEFLEQQMKNNKESEQAISELNDQISTKRAQLNQYTEQIQLQTNEFITLRRQLQHDTNRLQNLRQKNLRATIQCDVKTKEIAKLKEIVDELKSKLGKIQSEKNNAENRLRHLDELYEDEEKAVHAIELEMERLSQMVYRSSQMIQQQQNEQKLIESEIFTLETSIKMISANFTNQEKELAFQMEIQYDIHFKTVKMECRIAKMEGKVKDVDPQLVEKCENLQQFHAATSEKREKIKKELSSAEDMERRLKALLSNNQIEHIEMMNKLQNCQSECEAGLRLITTNREKLHERLVEHSLLKMRVHQIADLCNKQTEKFYDLEQHKIQLQLAVDERLVDLKCQMKLLTTKRKHLCAERDQLIADINERRKKIEALKARFELTHELLGKNEDGTAVSAIQLKMETAQEKAALLERGSKLNEQVLNAEADIKALENTLIMLNFSNDKYKQKMGQATDNDEFNEEMQKLSNEYATTLNRLKAAKVELENESKNLEEMQRRNEHMEMELDEVARNRAESNDALIKIHKEIMEQNSKVERAKREMKISKTAMMKKVGNREYVRLLEKDLETKEVENRNTAVLHQLGEIIEAVPGMSFTITKLLYEKGLEIPAGSQHNGSGNMSRTKSRMSMRSSGRVSECSLSVSRDDNAFLSKLSEGTLGSSSSNLSNISKTSTTKSKKSERTLASSSSSLNFHIAGQSIRGGKATK